MNRAIEINPNVVDVYCLRGLAKEDKGDMAGALADFNKALELKPDYALAQKDLDELKQKMGNK